jgi:Pyruvate/2-oxoacid:ferredoxin oxidoreductase delta subunit
MGFLRRDSKNNSKLETIDTNMGRWYIQNRSLSWLNIAENYYNRAGKKSRAMGCPVADIISLKNKKDLAKEKKDALTKKRKVLAVRRVFQCTQCAFKCEKCGTQINRESYTATVHRHNLRVPYNFCKACEEEYIDFIERLKGAGDPDCYWHNETWIDAWKKWIDFQSSMDRYLKSKEFVQLLNELKQTRPEE